MNAYNMCSQIIQEILDEIFDNLQLNKHKIIIWHNLTQSKTMQCGVKDVYLIQLNMAQYDGWFKDVHLIWLNKT